MASQRIRKVIFSGRVQGVGFRFTTQEIAQRYSVVGWVKNLSDGCVELAVAGTARQVDDFLNEICEQSRLARFIDQFEISEMAPEHFDSLAVFSIRR